jgi:hypothetical protein
LIFCVPFSFMVFGLVSSPFAGVLPIQFQVLLSSQQSSLSILSFIVILPPKDSVSIVLGYYQSLR